MKQIYTEGTVFALGAVVELPDLRLLTSFIRVFYVMVGYPKRLSSSREESLVQQGIFHL